MTSKHHQRIFIVGAGVMGRIHAASIKHLNVGDVELLVADPSEAGMLGFAAAYPNAKRFSCAATMLAQAPLPNDIVIVATPPFTHCTITLEALSTGRHVLCEKPLAMSCAEAHQMLVAAKKAQRLLGCCSGRFLGLPATDRIKKLINSHALGKLYHATFVNRFHRFRCGVDIMRDATWVTDQSKNGGGTLMDWAPYDFTTLNDVLQPASVEVLDAWAVNPQIKYDEKRNPIFNVEEHAGASLRYELPNRNNIHVTYERAACTHGDERNL